MRTETAWVLAMARGELGPMPAAGRPVAWDEVAALARHHGVAALCWQQCRGFAERPATEPGLPETLAKPLRAAFRAQTLRNMRVLAEIARLERELRRRAVETLYFKGPWVALAAYPALGARRIGDVDLGIRETQVREAVEALQAAGYRASSPLPRSPAEALRRAHYGRQLVFAQAGQAEVELHFRMINLGPPADEEWVWESARELEVAGTSIRVPGPEAMLLHLLLHANQHRFARLRLLHDVRWALATDGRHLDRERLRRQIAGLRAGCSAYHSLLLARDLAGAAVPEALLDTLRPSRPRRAIFTGLWRLSRARRLDQRQLPRALEAPLLYLLEMGAPRQKLRYLARVIAAALGPLRIDSPRW